MAEQPSKPENNDAIIATLRSEADRLREELAEWTLLFCENYAFKGPDDLERTLKNGMRAEADADRLRGALREICQRIERKGEAETYRELSADRKRRLDAAYAIAEDALASSEAGKDEKNVTR